MMLSETVRFLKYDQPFFVPGTKSISLHAEGDQPALSPKTCYQAQFEKNHDLYWRYVYVKVVCSLFSRLAANIHLILLSSFMEHFLCLGEICFGR